EWVHVQLHQQKGMISLSPPTICNSAECNASSRLEWKCGGAEQQDQTAEDKGQGIPKPGTL
ncbi:hypothetical protein AWF85_26385, partial [Escherichia coli]